MINWQHYRSKTVAFLLVLSFPALCFTQAPTVDFQSRIVGLVQPLDIVNAGDGSNRIFVVEKAGVIRVFDASYNELSTAFLNITADVRDIGSEEGLLSMAFHPNYEVNGMFWVYYTNNAGDLSLARYQVSAGDPDVANGASGQVILTIPHPTNSNHNGGKLNFGTDGFLYLSIGDGGGANDVPNNAQNGAVLLGKLIRIDVSTGGTASYTSPASNPYTITNDPGGLIRDEIWAMGLRNPFRWSFDAAGNIWIGDVGQNAWEEINKVANTAGLNYGWRCFEGNAPFNQSAGCPATYTFPIYVYPNESPSAVTGGSVYEGTAFPSLQGYYYASDVYSGNIYIINTSTNAVTVQTDVFDFITSFGVLENGEILVADMGGGAAWQLVPAGVLPVELLSFEAYNRNEVIGLTWRTAFEQNLEKFEVEFSTDRVNYEKVATVQARNVPNGATYSFNHIPNLNQQVWYRLKMLDFDGSFDYSNIIQVRVTKKLNSFIYPTLITNGSIDLYLSEEFQEFRMINAVGAIVHKQDIRGRSGHVGIDVRWVPAGVYIVQLTGTANSATQKIMIR